MQPLRFLLFFAIVGGITVLVHVYLYRRLVRDLGLSPALQRTGKLLIGGLWGALFLAGPLARFWRSAYADTFGAMAWSWMGLAVLLFTMLLAGDALGLLLGLAWRARSRAAAKAAPGGAPEPTSPERRLLLSRALAGGAVVASGGLASYGLWRAYSPPVITELSLVLPRLPRALDGVSIVQVSDIHVGPLIHRRFMDEMVRRCNALKPDLVAVTGDLMDGDVETLGPSVAALRSLSSRFGTYFITGNHEYYSGDLEWCAALEKMGLTVLRNRRVTVGDAGGSFDLIGVDDWSGAEGRRYDLDKAVEGRDPARAAVLLAHQPRNFEEAAEKGIGLQLSGHTHGGQLFPGTLLIPLLWPHSAGHYTHRDSHLYVSRGTGFWGPPLRVGSEPEIVKVVLRAG